MPKEKSLNPMAAHHKASKRAAVKKSKAAVAAARSERLSKRDPARLERQIAALHEQAAATPGGLKARDAELLRALERDVLAVRRARERAGLPTAAAEEGRWRGGGDEGAGRERKRGRREEEEGGSGTDEDVRRIPMPRDTPPPLPVVPRRGREREEKKKNEQQREAQVTYSSAPVMRDLKKEATGAKFAPAVVKRNIERAKGRAGLVEEEEWERLERAGYGGGQPQKKEQQQQQQGEQGPKGVVVEEVQDEDL